MQPPNYSSLLNEFLSHYQQPITVIESLEDNNNTAKDIIEFLGEELLWNEIIPAQTPNLNQLPKTLPQPLKKALKQMGITQLYSHQIKTLKAIRAGYDVILSTNTASGKTLSAYIPVIEGIINHNYRAISFYGLKALTSDQGQKLNQLINLIPHTYQPKLAILNGDIAIQEREQLLAKHPDIIGATPELIHYALKGTYWSEPWQQFLQNLRYIIIDEAHTFTGAYGANMANLIQRIKLAVDHYGGNSQQLQFIFLSATIGNPKQLAQRLSNRPQTKQEKLSLIWIKNSGASAPQRQLIVTKPSHNPNPDTARIILFLLSQGLTGICFCQGRVTIKNLLTTLKTEANNQNYWGIEQQIAIFYGGLTNERRKTIIEQLQRGQIRCILSTSALEAGIDLAALDFVIIRSFPHSLQSFRQRFGRAGRSHQGLAIFIPLQQSPLDQYYAQNPQLLLTAKAEKVSFNAQYPIDLGKHLMCAAVESGIPSNKLKYYFGKNAPQVASALINQGAMRKTKGRLWAKGFPHKDVNFRGNLSSYRVQLIDQLTGELIEEMSLEIAYREVFTGAIYRTQDSDGQLLTYRSILLNLETYQSILQPIAETCLYTVATSQTDSMIVKDLVQPRQLTCNLPLENAKIEARFCWGEVSNLVTGYQVLSKQYELSCLNQKCVNYREALPNHKFCPVCQRKTRKADLIQVVDEVVFEKYLGINFTTPMTQISVNPIVNNYLHQVATEMKSQQQNSEVKATQLWDYPPQLLALHSFGHQILAALPLVVLGSLNDVNFRVELRDKNDYFGYFYDLSEGGNGTAEAIWANLPKLAQIAGDLARNCPCQFGCPRCLILPGCPDGNMGLLKQMGLILCDAIAG